MKRQPEGEMGVVVQIGPGRNDPVDEPGFEQRNDGAHPEPGWGHRAGQAHPDRHVGFEHPPGKEVAGFLEPPRVIGQKRVVDQLGDPLLAGDGFRIDPGTLEKGSGRELGLGHGF